MDRETNLKLLSFLGAMCLFLSAIEYSIPKPVPFFRLGLANLPLILGLYILPSKEYFALAALKILGQNLITGALFSYICLFSLTGTISAALIMFILHRLFYRRKLISNVGISTGGALANALSQIFIARLVLFGENARFIAPVLLLMSLITGILLGVFSESFCKKSIWFKTVKDMTFYETVEEKQNV